MPPPAGLALCDANPGRWVLVFEAETEERDKSPIYLAPNISVYTK